jgi:hypothetical protein
MTVLVAAFLCFSFRICRSRDFNLVADMRSQINRGLLNSTVFLLFTVRIKFLPSGVF